MILMLPWFSGYLYQPLPNVLDMLTPPATAEDGLEQIEILHGNNPQWVVIWLHGLGADGHDFEPIVPELGLGAEPGVKFIFPHAPVRPITVNGGMRMRGWYDIKSMDIVGREDPEGIQDSEQKIRRLIQSQIESGIPSDRIILAGFSQGGAVALHTALRYQHRLAGVIALSTYVPLTGTVKAEVSESNLGIPIFMAHGDFDPVVAPQLGLNSMTLLEELGYDVEWRTYPMPHSVSPEEIRNIGNWMQGLFQ